MIALLKKVLIVIGILTLVIGGYFLLSPNPGMEGRRSLDLLQRGDFDKAEASLQEKKNVFTEAQYDLYRAYILRAKGQLAASDEQLKLAEKSAKIEDAGELLQEVLLNQAYNYYLENKPTEMSQVIDQVEKISSKDNEWVKFFRSLNERMGKQEARSFKGWQKSEKLVPLSNWMKQEILDNFNDFWFYVQDIRNDIILQNFILARRKLEEKSASATESQIEDINFLSGMIYIKEGELKGPAAAGAYYKLAFTHFDKVPMAQKRFAAERNEVLALVNKQIDYLMKEKKYQDLPFYASILKRWNALEDTEQLQANLMVLLKEQSSGENEKDLKSVIDTLNELVTERAKRDVLERMFVDLINQSLANGNLEPADTFWEGAKVFSSNNEALTITVSNEIVENALKLIPVDDEDLTQTLPYLEFWNYMMKNPETREAFANQLLSLAPQLWKDDKNPKKSLQLIRVASVIVPLKLKDSFQKKTEETLALIKKEYAERVKLAKQLYDQKKYEESWNILSNALKMDSKDETALLYGGLTAYQLGNYPDAQNYLGKVFQNHPEVKLELAVSAAIMGDTEKKKELLEGDLKPQVDQALLRRITLGTLMYRQPDESVVWEKMITGDDEESVAIRFIVAAMSQNWKVAFETYEKLSNKYKSLDGVRGLYIQTLLALDKTDEAEKEINRQTQTLKNKEDISSFPLLFRQFMTAKLDIYSSDYISGLYYLSYKNEPQKALEFFKKIPEPPPQVLLKLGLAYDLMHEDGEALKALSKALKGNQNQQFITQNAHYIMAKIYTENGFYADAVLSYQQYLEGLDDEVEDRVEYATDLMQVRRYDLAAEQFFLIEKARPLKEDEQIDFIETLIRTGDDPAAKARITNLIGSISNLNAGQKGQLAHLILMMRDQSQLSRIINDLQNNKEDFESLKALFSGDISVGDFKAAQAILESNLKAFEDDTEGRYLLARYYQKQGKPDESRKYLLNSIEITPRDQAKNDFVEYLWSDSASIDHRIAQIKSKEKEFPDSVSLSIDLARQYIDRAIDEHFENQDTPVAKLIDLRNSAQILDPLTLKYSIFPEIYLLQGQLNFIADKNTEALDSLKKAIDLDPSYEEAYKYQAMIYLEQFKPNEAVFVLMKALQFRPDDASLWKRMADAYQMKGDALSADSSIKYAIKYEPNNPEFYLFLGKLKFSLENAEDSLTNLEIAYKLAPDNLEVMKALYATLSDPHLLRTSSNSDELKQRREEIFEKLKAIDPEMAEKLKTKHSFHF